MSGLDKEDFMKAVYQMVRYVPKGRATSYGAIARAIGYPNLSRLVGRVLGQIPVSESDIPAHRVVNSQGNLTGKEAFGSPDQMLKLLEAEGIVVINNRIQNWKSIFWNPLNEIVWE